jgi:predicted nucleic acid-binding protein
VRIRDGSAKPLKLILDSTVLIDLLRQRPHASEQLRAHLRAGDDPCTTVINIEEVVRGLRPAEVPRAQRLFEGLVLVPLGRAEGWIAGHWRREYAGRGITLTQADCLIASAALSVEARLATSNSQDFPMPEIEVEHWPVGE